ncbi:MAG: transposase [Candidatus Beckwithbacteria bacterium]|nr:transposase [Patescibacteria group bacterium]
MPGKNTIKEYFEDSFYHIYNRGVEKRIIFQDKLDYKTFLSYLKLYLSPPLQLPAEISAEFRRIAERASLNNLFGEVKLISYCLMPNHFHFLVKQKPINGIEKFMRSIGTKYTMYFNKKYKRVGKLYQGTYKAVLVKSEAQLLHLSRYIHLNPVVNQKLEPRKLHQKLISSSSYSSYANYLKLRNTTWLKSGEILEYFNSANLSSSYQNFVEKHYTTPSEETISKLLLE